jgi:predicted glycogen debranching enzyme
MTMETFSGKEWLEADGLGGFASSGADGIRTRRYHALLLTATTPPTGRFVLVNGFDVWVQTGSGMYAISSQRYVPDVVHPDGNRRIQSFTIEPWPTWIYLLEDGVRIRQEIVVKKDSPITLIRWHLEGENKDVRLTVRPFFSGRDYHSMHHENSAFRFDPITRGQQVVWHPYDGLPEIVMISNGIYTHVPLWYRNFFYEKEHERGLDDTEDLASPGTVQWDFSKGDAFCLFTTESLSEPAESLGEELCKSERARRKKFPNRLQRSADDYIVAREKGKTIAAGYPWFTDWGRDTFISLRGLCLATGRLQLARTILLEWANLVSEGMLPNRFPDQSSEPEYNSVDASLWYVIAVADFLSSGAKTSQRDVQRLQNAVQAIVEGYEKGTRFGIKMDEDALLFSGQPGSQLTWMDAKIGDWVVTPRIGKPVEVQALWLNALNFYSALLPRAKTLFDRGREAFQQKFWNENGGYLYDVIDVDHIPGKVDDAFRPNQIFAIGGLPVALLSGEKARQVVDAVESRLLTPLGLRSLAPGSTGYSPRYTGGPRERDAIYHQGIVWPWLIGAFIEAWLRVNGSTEQTKKEAHRRFVEPLLAHLNDAGLGHLPEIADAEPPYTPRGCPFQAWSVGELLRSLLLCG